MNNDTIKQYNIFLERLNISIKRMNYRRHFDSPTKFIGLINESMLMHSDLPILNHLFSRSLEILPVYEKELFKDREDVVRLNELEQELKKIVGMFSELKCLTV